jgi:uncharacterized protein YndB with AHSA1/START domain
MANLVAKTEIDIAAPAAEVWQALTDPELIAEYFFGSKVETDWQPGSQITWSGEYEGKSYQDKGEVVEVEPDRRLVVTHFSPLSGQPDEPENYHTLTYEIDERGDSSHVSMSQDNNQDEDEVEHSRENWSTMLAGLKKTVEGRREAG